MYAHTGQEASPSKSIHQIESMEIGPGPEPDTDIRALSWDDKKKKGKAPALQSNKCFNCGQDRHRIQDCKNPKNQCSECKFHGGGHWRNCLKYIAKACATLAEQTTAHMAPSIAKDPIAAIRGMDFEQRQVYFWDKKDLTEKLGKGKAQ